MFLSVSEADTLSPIEIGENVICWLEDGTTVQRGVVLSVKEESFAVVDFDDGSFSSNLYLGQFRIQYCNVSCITLLG